MAHCSLPGGRSSLPEGAGKIEIYSFSCPERVWPFVVRLLVTLKPQKPKHMNIKITSLCTALLLAAFAGLNADEPTKKAGSPEFERMKTLVGTWTGKTDMGQGPVDMTIQYRLIAGGSVLEERFSPGTPHEMVSMYYDKAGKLAMTHYCILGNRPEMALKASDKKSITFDLDASC